MHPVTLQISTAPTDIRFLEAMIAHQIKVLGSQVQEILIVGDIQSGKGRFQFDDETVIKFKELLEKIQSINDKVRIAFVDYNDTAQNRVAQTLWGKNELPVKDYRGGPFYSYFYGIAEASNDYILHLDSDILLGGGLHSWCEDAVNLYGQNEKIACIIPLSGPTPSAGHVPEQYERSQQRNDSLKHTYVSKKFSTRVFLISKSRFSTMLKNISIKRPDLFRSLLGILHGNPLAKAPEQLIENYFYHSDYHRVDYLGKKPGLWTLHPPFRSEAYYKRLDFIIDSVESDKIPEEQRGHYDLNKGFIDWHDAVENLPFYRRFKARKKII